jgi:peptide/nickel transport system substrate-binding protein
VQIFCLNNAVEPLNNAKVRQALSYVVDTQEITELVHSGHAERAASPVIPALKTAYESELNGTYKKDVSKAKSLLAEAGYEDGFSLTITVPSTYEPHVNTAQVIINQLAEIGVKAEIRQVDWPTWLSDVYMGRNYQTTVISIDGVTLSPRSYLSRYVSDAGDNFINYANPRYDAVYAQVLASADEAERIRLYKELQRILSDDAASVFLCDISAPKVFRKDIKGYRQYPVYVFDASTGYIEE